MLNNDNETDTIMHQAGVKVAQQYWGRRRSTGAVWVKK